MTGTPPRGHGERGQTIILVAISIVSLLAMAALAIDVVSLYVARSEVQRAADAAALVGAKAIADSGVTSLPPGDTNAAAAKALALSMATSSINALLTASPALNQVAGSQPVLVGGTPTIVYNDPGGNNATSNPIITVQLQRTGLPTFFARVFGQTTSTTSATAVAEAYNPANIQDFTPISIRAVKPWLLANYVPGMGGANFITPSSGAIGVPLTDLIGLSFDITANCHPLLQCQPLDDPMVVLSGKVEYLPALVTPNPFNVCPACAGASPFEQSIECSDVQTYSCGGNDPNGNAYWDPTVNPANGGASGATAMGAACLINHSGGLPDSLDYPTPWPTSGPFKITAGSGSQAGTFVSTSSSVVAIPIIDTCIGGGCINSNLTHSVTVIGFLQAFINGPGTVAADVNIRVLNVIACSQTPNGNRAMIGGNGASAIPVRLITPP